MRISMSCVAAATALLASSPASADFGCTASSPCTAYVGDFNTMDYTIYEGAWYVTLYFQSASPTGAAMSDPNENWTFTYTRGAGGTIETDANPNAPYSWEQVAFLPNAGSDWGYVRYRVATPLDFFNDCSNPGPVGSVCGIEYQLWGNGTWVAFTGADDVRYYATAIAAPEPAQWALLIGGFGLAGAALRRRSIATHFAA